MKQSTGLQPMLVSLALALLLLAHSLLAPAVHGATITYQGSITYTSASGNVTSFSLTKPAATRVTDVLVAQITIKGTGIAITPPAGWTQVFATSNGLTQYIYYKVATDSEPASYTWTISPARVVAAGLALYRGVTSNTAAIINASGAQTQGGVNGSITAPSITATVANTMLLAFFAGASNTTITANSPLTGQYSLNNGGTNVADGAGYQLLTAAGATGTRTATVRKGAKLAGSGNAVGQMVALAPSSLDHFVIEAVGGGSLPAQMQRTPFNVQIRAVDSSGATVTSYGGKVTVSSTGTLSAGSGTTGTFVNGVLTPWSLAYSNFGSFTITVTDYTIPTITGSAAVTVNPILDHFTVQATGGGSIPNQTTGVPFSILITAQTSANTTFTSFTGTVTITSTGTLDAGGGTTASFTGGVLTQSVTISNAGTWTITATQTSGTATGTSNSFSVGTVGDFNVFESSLPAGTVNGYIGTKIAGVPFGLDVIAVNTTTNTVNTSFNDSVKVEILGSTRTGISVGANSCPTNSADYTVLQTVSSAPITNGRSTVNFAAVADVWRESRVRVTYPASGTPTTVVCSDDVFAIRPSFLAVAVTDGNWQTAGTTRALANTAAAGGAVHKAGQPFTITVTAYNGAATPAVTGNYTVNYTPSPAVQTLACQLPTGCVNGALNAGTWTVTGPGVVQTATAAYSEAGTFSLALHDLAFASDDTGDPVSPAIYPVPQGGGALGVGRFVPDHFVLAANNAPIFRTFNTTDASCSTPVSPDTARAFTYIGQQFGYATTPQLLVTAQNAANATTANYSGTLWKINPAADVTQTYVNTPIPPDTPPPLTSQLQTPTAAPSGGGAGIVTANGADLLSFTRTPLTPQGTFNADISLAVNVQDSSESAVSGNGTILSTGAVTFDGTSGNGIDFDSGDLFIFGQLEFPPPAPVGLATLPLNIPIGVQWYDDIDYSPGQFVITDNDYCTTYGSANVSLSNWTGNLLAGDTWANGSGKMIQGVTDPANPLYLAAPKSAHDGTVTVTYAAPSWLSYNSGNPSVVATFQKAPAPSITILKSVRPISDPVNGTSNPKNVPGALLEYTLLVTNFGNGATDGNSLVISDALPSSVAMIVNGSPVSCVDGTPASGLTFNCGVYNDGTDQVFFSRDGSSWNYTPVPGANNSDPLVRYLKVVPAGQFNGTSGGGNPNFTISFRAIIN